MRFFVHKIMKSSWRIAGNRGPLCHHKIGFSKEFLIITFFMFSKMSSFSFLNSVCFPEQTLGYIY